MGCETCDNTGWVCEAHPDRPWNGPNACGCGGAGMACIISNGDGEKPDMSRVMKSALVVSGKKALATARTSVVN